MTAGVTPSEKYLYQLASKSFLSLWSYPNLYTDEGRKNDKGSGKELCDLVIIFGDHVLLFSDKHCEYSNDNTTAIAWPRWYRKAILKSARQLVGAESWIKRFPNHIFLDNNCRQKLPHSLPPENTIKFHKFAVTRGSYSECIEYFGGKGTGSLIINTAIVGDEHENEPFSVGFILPSREYIHVLSELSLEILLKEFDTITDFIGYIEKKELLIAKEGRTVLATGEEQLVAEYMRHLNSENEHCFGEIPEDIEGVFFDEGSWEEFIQSDEYKSKKEADKQSYIWDRLIEHFIETHNKTGIYGDQITLQDIELALRILAMEPRIRRRMLAPQLIEVLQKDTKPGSSFAQLDMSNSDPDVAYVFLSLPRPDYVKTYEEYREYRKYRVAILADYCRVAKLRAVEAKVIVGIAKEPHSSKGASEDLVYLKVDEENWGAEEESEARTLQKEGGLFLDENVNQYNTTDNEYPVATYSGDDSNRSNLNRAQRRAIASKKRKRKR